ncbi:Glycosyltransferase involved in cell wall bisynthesis [Salegentibacter holothuriorum]|uniref:Glycosyltransferase involved in cell wall bisynthesis n=1 Tax=Salegentibacter holothuriorum TaxID=241145 RepID=A0A1T5CS20_9FLAO|nr:glycosyltransferase family 4 protein [Salegentibacter holothuriorum]SKB62123.1 Glycosyltransferase involved in cell wall bisynthesis [Salegentibacter holothuriorum]
MKKILLSAFACNPKMGSEEGNGWNWSLGLANKGFEVHCLTRQIGKSAIDEMKKPENLYFHYIKLPMGLEKLYSSSRSGMYLYYLLWQLLAFRKARSLNKKLNFSIAHHVTWGSVQLGSFIYKLNISFVFGPAGGGQISPIAFKNYFGKSWNMEEKRNKVSAFLLKYNPACRKMLKRASAVWVSNRDTADLVKKIRFKEVKHTLDIALPEDFYPINFEPKKQKQGSLKLLWVGRLMPRKGVMLLLDVMEKLKEYPGIVLTMVGDGEQREKILEAVKIKELDATVIFNGKVPYKEVKKFYASNDVFFFTSLRDSGGSQLVEAMAFGMPVVSINLHGQSVIINDETGFRCPCKDPAETIDALVNAILKLYYNPDLLSSMSLAAHKFALQQTWSQKIDKVVDQSYV